ncbi:MAG: hypothetical protein U9N47_00425, partial [Thermodesulfobacteriota bacterium]|nr:hypothetical protein [Thermodesulfobacteriota bacterium]
MSKSKGLSGSIKKFIVSIPRNYIVKTGNILGSIAYLLDARHRRIARRNLRFAYPEWPLDKINKISRKTFQNMGIT